MIEYSEKDSAENPDLNLLNEDRISIILSKLSDTYK